VICVLRSVDGALLISLTDDQMRTALGILPLGHREALRNKVKVGPGVECSHVDVTDQRYQRVQSQVHRCCTYATLMLVNNTAAFLYGLQELKDMVEAAGQDNSMHRKGPGAREHPRGPASASPNVIPPDSHLGPAQVSERYEQVLLDHVWKNIDMA
jgi:hypothetical protein